MNGAAQWLTPASLVFWALGGSAAPDGVPYLSATWSSYIYIKPFIWVISEKVLDGFSSWTTYLNLLNCKATQGVVQWCIRS